MIVCVWKGLMIAVVLAGPILANPLAAQSVSFPAVHDLDARSVDLNAFPDDVIVLIFVATDCPISNRYLPEFQRIERTLTGRPVKLWLVYSNPSDHAGAVRTHLSQYHIALPALLDIDQSLVTAARVHLTPEASVFSRAVHGARREVYRGRIDDRYVSFGHEKPAATRHELVNAIDAALDGRTVSAAGGPPIGCAIVPVAMATP